MPSEYQQSPCHCCKCNVTVFQSGMLVSGWRFWMSDMGNGAAIFITD